MCLFIMVDHLHTSDVYSLKNVDMCLKRDGKRHSKLKLCGESLCGKTVTAFKICLIFNLTI